MARSIQQLQTASLLDHEMPASREAERLILGAILLDDSTLNQATARLQREDFFFDAHRRVFAGMLLLADAERGIDPITLADVLKSSGDLERVGGPAAISELFDGVPRFSNIEEYVGIVREKATLRQSIRLGQQLVQRAFDGEVAADLLLAEAERAVVDLRQLGMPPTGLISQDEACDDLLVYLQERWANPGVLPGLATGFHDLDNVIGGLQPEDLVILAARPGEGKCLGYGTKVMLNDGTTREVQDIRTGDLLMGPDGQPRRVQSTTRGQEMLWRVKQRRGIDYVVNESHILSLRVNRDRGRWKKGEIVNLSVADYLAQGDGFRHSAKGWKAALDFEDRPVPVDPYFLGIWLGDGASANTRITTPEPEIESWLREFAAREGLVLKFTATDGLATTWSVNSGRRHGNTRDGRNTLLTRMRDLGVIDNKHIPELYKLNSRRVRLELLAGFIDTDGFLGAGTYETSQVNETLARDIVWLARSLGFYVSLSKIQKTCANNGVIGTYWRIWISGNIEEIPVRVPRRKAPPRKMNKDCLRTGISLERVGHGDYYGFELDGDGLFLLEDFTVTHNTTLAMNIKRNVTQRDPDRAVFVVSLEMSARRLLLRDAAAQTGIDYKRILRGQIDADEQRMVSIVIDRELRRQGVEYFDTTNETTVDQIALGCERVRRERGRLDLIIVDHLHLVDGAGESQNAVISKISRGLKRLTTRYKCPVLALAQLNREVEKRVDRRCRLSDLRDSGSIEQDASVVMFINRTNPDGPECEIDIAKNRDGETAAVPVLFFRERSLFTSAAR